MAKTRRAPGFKKWTIGNVTVTRILEMDTLVLPPEYMLKTTTGTVLEYDWLQTHYATPEGHLLSHIQAFILEIGQLRIMVDPCVGNHKPRWGAAFFNMLNTPFLDLNRRRCAFRCGGCLPSVEAPQAGCGLPLEDADRGDDLGNGDPRCRT